MVANAKNQLTLFPISQPISRRDLLSNPTTDPCVARLADGRFAIRGTCLPLEIRGRTYGSFEDAMEGIAVAEDYIGYVGT